jgi:hypothetical protein
VASIVAKGTGQLARLRTLAKQVDLVIRTCYFPMDGILKPLDHRLEVAYSLLEVVDPLDGREPLGPRPPACDAENAVTHCGSCASGELPVDYHDPAQVEHRAGLIFHEPLQPLLQLLDALQLELSEQGDARALTLRGDIKLDRHLTEAFRPSQGIRAEGRGIDPARARANRF